MQMLALHWHILNLTGSGYYSRMGCFGIRPVVVLKSGVYIASGDGTEENPYILGKD